MTVDVLIEKNDESWGASTLDDAIGFIGAFGDTRDEAITKFRTMLRDHLAFMAEEGQHVPPVTELEIRELVAI